MTTTDETWLPIPGYEGAYEVSDQGRVRSLDRRIIADGPLRRNYQRSVHARVMTINTAVPSCPRLKLSKAGVVRLRTVRSLVREAFGCEP
jgi:hypothetical protein